MLRHLCTGGNAHSSQEHAIWQMILDMPAIKTTADSDSYTMPLYLCWCLASGTLARRMCEQQELLAFQEQTHRQLDSRHSAEHECLQDTGGIYALSRFMPLVHATTPKQGHWRRASCLVGCSLQTAPQEVHC